jgi:hypothetical protein
LPPRATALPSGSFSMTDMGGSFGYGVKQLQQITIYGRSLLTGFY